MKMRLTGFFLILSLFCGCKSVGVSESKIEPIGFASLRQVPVQNLTMAQAKIRFGEPTRVENHEKGSAIWHYDNADGGQLLLLEFNSKSSKLTSMAYLAQEKGRDLTIDDVKRAYPNARFTSSRIVEAKGSDYISNDYNYEDKTLGLNITTRGPEKIDFIAWYQPDSERQPSSK